MEEDDKERLLKRVKIDEKKRLSKTCDLSCCSKKAPLISPNQCIVSVSPCVCMHTLANTAKAKNTLSNKCKIQKTFRHHLLGNDINTIIFSHHISLMQVLQNIPCN